jgi:hypothetical protein
VGPNKQYKLNAKTVFDDNTLDHLVGEMGMDWYFASTTGTNKDTHDKAANEQVVEVT